MEDWVDLDGWVHITHLNSLPVSRQSSTQVEVRPVCQLIIMAEYGEKRKMLNTVVAAAAAVAVVLTTKRKEKTQKNQV